MREVTMAWNRADLARTPMAALDDIVQRLSITGNLLINSEGVRQLLAPVYREGKGVDDLGALPFLEVEQVLNKNGGDALVAFNTHPLVRLATTTENIHILVPCLYEDGGFTLTIRGLPDAVARFVRLSKTLIPPSTVTVQHLEKKLEGFKDHLTPRQLECFLLAAQHGYYDDPKRITMQGLAEVKGIARSTFQEHLNMAEQTALKWVAEQMNE
jgi:hypothetical protein